MTLSMIIGIGIGVLFAWRVSTIAVRVWRAWGVAEAEAERQRLERAVAASQRASQNLQLLHASRASQAPRLKRDHKRVS